jgi:TFIIF-interacting CTD phosphatase-like protein
MNPQQGLRIRPFRGDPHDDELLRLLEYLMLIAGLDSLSRLRHSRWEKYVMKHRQS